MRPRNLLTLTLLLAALAVAGCGGGGGATETTAETTEARPSPTKAELISQGDAICAEVNAAVGSVGASTADTQTQITQTASLYINLVDSLLRLGTPQENAGYSDFIAAAEQLAKVEGEVKLAAEREDAEALGDAGTRATPALEEFQAQAAIYGFEQCSQAPSVPTPAPEGGEEGGIEAEGEVEEVAPEEVAPEEAAPETGGAGGGIEEVAPETGGGTGGGGGGESGGVGPG